MDFIHKYESPFGAITLACSDDALTGLWFDGQKHFGSTLSAQPEERMTPVFEMAEKWLDIYFSGEDPGFTPPLELRGMPFQRKVWDILITIPFGETVTYGQIAHMLAESEGMAKMSARAVGSAVGRNPVLLIVPCHRVIGVDGSLTGYAAGTEIKKKLLEMEMKAHGIL